jgi:hypothetical protein
VGSGKEASLVTFMGETVDVNVADLLSVLARRRLTGRLGITADGDEILLFLEQGRLVSVSSSSHGLRLGRTLVRLGILDQKQLEAAIQEQEMTGHGRPLGQILLDRGWVTSADLERAAEEQCIEALARVIVARRGTFMFSQEASPRVPGTLVALSIDRIVLEASRRADEMMTLRSLLPPPDVRLALAQPAPAGSYGLTAVETRVAEALRSGAATLEELARQLPVEDVALWRAVVSLRERGFLVTRSPESAEEVDAAPVKEEGVAARTIEELVALGREGAQDAVVAAMPTLAEIRAGTPASAQTVAAITLVVREVIAAFNAGLPLRAFAHFSDDHFRRQGPLAEEEAEALRQPVLAVPPEEQETVIGVREVRLLPDGRVSAILISHFPATGELRKVLIFVRSGDRWQVDAVIEGPVPASMPQPSPGGRHASENER